MFSGMVAWCGGGAVEGVGAGVFEETAEVAVGEDAEEAGVWLHGQMGGRLDGGEAEAFGGHLVDDLGHGCVGRHDRNGVSGVHELLDDCVAAGEAAAELAAGVQLGEVLGLEVEAAADVDGEGVAEGEHGGGGGGGSELVVAGFAGYRDVERVRAGGGECRGGAAGEANEGDAELW
jgi:hypothetical protein